MTAMTPLSAQTYPCPIARVKGNQPPPAKCEADACILWRWLPLDAAAPAFKEAVSAQMKALGGGAGHHKAAVAWVMENREALGLPTKPTHGFCGLGGQVLA